MKIKRIIEGRTYNTETATFIQVKSTDHGKPGGRQDSLYLSRSGRYFLVRLVRSENSGLLLDEIVPMSRDQAREWYGDQESDAPQGWFGKDTEDENGMGEAVINIRMSKMLLHWLNTHACASGQSRNAWICQALQEQLRIESGGRFFGQSGVPITDGIASYSDD